jgi:hypothetical protein
MVNVEFKEHEKVYTINLEKSKSTEKFGELLPKWQAGECFGASMIDLRLWGVRHFVDSPKILCNCYNSVTFYAQKGDFARYILPKRNHELSPAIEHSLKRIAALSTDERRGYHCGIDLDYRTGKSNETGWSIYNQWEGIGGVYTVRLNKLIKTKKSMIESFNSPQDAKNCLAIRLQYGHPDEVAEPYASTQEEFNEIIDGIFRLTDRRPCMDQHLLKKKKIGYLSLCLANALHSNARTCIPSYLFNDSSQVPFVYCNDNNV